MDLLDLGHVKQGEESAFSTADKMNSDFQIQGLNKLTVYHIKHFVLHQFFSMTLISLAQTLTLKRSIVSLQCILPVYVIHATMAQCFKGYT